MKYSKEIGKRLQEARKEAHYTQQQVADMLGLKQSAYARYESGIIELNYEQIRLFCNMYNIDPNFLFGYDETKGTIQNSVTYNNATHNGNNNF